MKTKYINPQLRLLTLISALICGAPLAHAQVLARYQLVYTQGAENAKGGQSQIRAALRNGRNRSNDARTQSRTDSGLTIANFHKSNFNDSARGRTNRDAFNALVRGTLSGQRERERSMNVDLVVVTTNAARDGGLRGLGQRPGAYSMGHVDFIQRHVQGHETGHNYSGIHDEAHRFTPNGREYFTMIRGGLRDARLGRVINRYSNPNVQFRGGGTSCCGRNNAGRLRGQRFTRANRRN